MRTIRFWILGALIILFLLWAGIGGLVWSRNRVPALALPAAEKLPAGNVYEQYLQCVASLPPADKQTVRVYNALGQLSPETKQELLTRNSALLVRFHKLPGHPSVVTERETKAHFVAALDYPFLSGLVALEGEAQNKRNPEQALHTLLDGLTFGEDVIRGGAFVHLTAGASSPTPVCKILPTLLPSLSAEACAKGAERVRALLDAQYPLPKIIDNERFVRMGRFCRAYEPNAASIFRFQIPTDGYLWGNLLEPKTEALTSLDRYFVQWTEEAKKPVQEVAPPELPETVKTLLKDQTIEPGSYMGFVLLYHYKETRLRLVYTGLLLERFRKTHGQYPASLSELGNDPYVTDPFSDKPFIYRREGNAFVFYSVGPNGTDDGNAPEPSFRGGMSVHNGGDISFAPQLAGTLQNRQR